MTQAIGRFAVASLLMCLSHGVADAQDVATPWDVCLKAPVRACVLEEALSLALSIDAKGQRARLLRGITEAWAKGGDLYQASRVAILIPDGPPMSVLLAIAEAQVKAGRRKDAGETIARALERAYSLKDRLAQAHWLHAIARIQMEAGATAEAAVTFDQALQSAQSFRIDARPGKSTLSFTARSLDGLLKALATEQAEAGQIAEAMQIAHSIKHDVKARVDALRAISAVQTKAGSTGEAAATLDEALANVRQAQSSPELWPHDDWDWRIFLEMLCDIAKMQARGGMMEKAAATFDAALQVVPTIQDSVAGKRDWATAVALTDIAEAQREAGLASAALATLDRAVEAAGAAKQDYKREYWVRGRSALAKAGGAQARAGLAAAAAATINLAIERARAPRQESRRCPVCVPTMALSHIARMGAEIGLRAEADRTFDEALGFARTIADEMDRGYVLFEIAEEQLTAGLLDRAKATFGEALSCLLLSQNGNRWQPNLEFYVNRVFLGDRTTRFIATSSALRPQIVQIAQLFYVGSRRAEILRNIANVLPN